VALTCEDVGGVDVESVGVLKLVRTDLGGDLVDPPHELGVEVVHQSWAAHAMASIAQSFSNWAVCPSEMLRRVMNSPVLPS